MTLSLAKSKQVIGVHF